MQHPDEGTIHSWLDGALSPDEAAQVEAHVKDCPQCQAAVAEARGFIAASSRILTALDNAPRGVIPAARPVKRVDPMVWRIAATVLVVAGGTFLVVRNNGVESRPIAPLQATSGRPVQLDSESGDLAKAAPTSSPVGATDQAPPVVSQGGSGAAANPAQGIVSNPPQNAGRIASPESRIDRTEAQKSAIVLREHAELQQRNGAAVAAAPAPSLPASPGAPALRYQSTERNGMAAMDAAAEEPKLREIGPGKRALGEKRTLYEVSPGDTVMLAEPAPAYLESVVVTGAMETRTQAASGMAVTTGQARTTAKTAAPAESPRPAAAPPPPAVVPAMPSFSEGADGVNTLTWRDSASGKVMKLSGHHTRAELEIIRRRIDQMRAAAAPRDSVKKD